MRGERRPAVDGGRELPVPVDPRIVATSKPGDQLLAVYRMLPRDGLQDPAHYLGGLGRIRRAPPQHRRHGVLARPVKPVPGIDTNGLSVIAASIGLPGAVGASMAQGQLPQRRHRPAR